MSVKLYEDLSWFGKILYRLRLIKAVRKSDLKSLIENQRKLESLVLDDMSYHDYLMKHF